MDRVVARLLLPDAAHHGLVLSIALLSCVDSTPRDHRLKAGNAARTLSTGAGHSCKRQGYGFRGSAGNLQTAPPLQRIAAHPGTPLMARSTRGGPPHRSPLVVAPSVVPSGTAPPSMIRRLASPVTVWLTPVADAPLPPEMLADGAAATFTG